MNNLATSLVQQNSPNSSHTVGTSSASPPASPTNQIASATQWAQKALKLGQSIQPPSRSKECDEGCVVATINLGDFAALEGRTEEARRYWEEGRGLAKAVGMKEGFKRAEEGLRDLEKKGV